MKSLGSLSRNIWLLWGQTFLSGLIFYHPILSLYLQGELDDFVLIAIIFAVESIAIIILEVPSGAVADLFGKKKSLIIASFLQFVAIFFLWIGHSMGYLLVYALIGALAHSMVSGTTDAMLYDSKPDSNSTSVKSSTPGSKLESIKSPKVLSFKQIIAINGVLWPLAASISALIGGFLSEHSYRLPVAVALIPLGISAISTFFLQEDRSPSFVKSKSTTTPETSSEENQKSQISEVGDSVLTHIGSSLRNIATNRQLLLLFFSGLFAFAFAEVAFQFKGIYLDEISLSLQYFGVISMISFGCSFLGSFSSDWASKRWDDKWILIMCQIMLGVFLIGSTFIPFPLFSAIFLSLESFFWGLRFPIQSDWINSLIDSKERATINSVTSMSNQLGFALVSPFMGYFMGILSMGWIYRILGGVQIFTVIFLLGLQNRNSTDTVLNIKD
ncbi:MAG: MFS transporter [Promethearchaeota archaeon]